MDRDFGDSDDDTLDPIDALRDWLRSIASKPTVLNDLQEIASEITNLRGFRTADIRTLTLLAHAALTDAFRAGERGETGAVIESLAVSVSVVLVLSERHGVRLAEVLLPRLLADLEIGASQLRP